MEKINFKLKAFLRTKGLLFMFLVLPAQKTMAQTCTGILPSTISAINNPTVCKDSSISVVLSVTGQPGANYQWIKNADWQNVGNSGFSGGNAAYTSIALDSAGTPYVLYSDDSNMGKATVMKYDGSNWIAVGAPGFSSDYAYYTSLAISDSNFLYAAFFDAGNGSAATVMKFDGSNWVNVGIPGFTWSAANYTTIAIDHNETPYVVYTDYYDSLNVMKFDGSNWNSVGTGVISEGKTYSPSIAIAPDNTPYVAYSDDAGSYKPVVKKFDGSNWINVGVPAFAADTSDDVVIAISDSGKVYLAYGNYEDNFRTNAWVFDTSWTRLGQPNFSALTEDWLTLKLDGSGTPYIAYQDGAYGQKITVKKFDGSDWVDVGNPGFSPDLIYYSSLAFDRKGTPFVAYNDYGNGGKANVMKFDGAIVGADSSNFTATDTGCYSVKVATCKGGYSLNTMCVEISDLDATLGGKTDVSCFGANDGTATIEPVGGAAPFSYSWSLNGTPIQMNDTATGLSMNSYIGTLIDSNMCPASITVNITEPAPVDTSVTISGATLTANAASASYQWIDCSNGNSALSGETNKSFSPLINGTYAVIITENGSCTDTSGCYNISNAGIKNLGNEYETLIYPNPSNGSFIIKTKSAGSYRLINGLGELVKEFSAGNETTINVTDLSSGVYYLTIQTQNTVIKQKVAVIKN